ncbi:MAG: hypothetical protein LBC31_11610 [Treponema sp.]|jgi:hypothetical protein|nr:hypothetical protein [Treponema sp.]
MLSVTVDDFKKIGQVKDLLLGCSNEESIDAVFSQFGINDFPLKTMFLRHTMQVQEVFDVPTGQSPTDEAEYREELRFFFDGKWKELV